MTDLTALAAAHPLELETALALADANEATGFPPPPHVQAVIDLAGDAEVAAAREAMKARREQAEADALAEQQAAETKAAKKAARAGAKDTTPDTQSPTPPDGDAGAQPKE